MHHNIKQSLNFKTMRSLNLVFGTVIAMLLISSCKETNLRAPASGRGVAPDPVTNVETKSIPGGATITYSLPDNDNLLYVKAVFKNKDKERVTKSSIYKDSIVVNGYADTTEKEVKLYTVTRGEMESEPVYVTVKPLTPPFKEIANTASISTTFGGVRVDYTNETGANIIFTVLVEDSLGEMREAEKYYSDASGNVSFFARGFEARRQKFGLFVEDEFGNRSDILVAELTPLFEERIPKDKFKNLALPNDTWKTNWGSQTIDKIWDDITGVRRNVLVTENGTGFPQWFTIDMGVKARFSRFKMYHRMHSQALGSGQGGYVEANPKDIELWGSNDPNPDGSWGNWTKIAALSGEIPSGEANPTAEDIHYAVYEGEDFLIPNAADKGAYRYIRFKTLDVWGNKSNVTIAELTFWGELVDGEM